MSKALLVNAAPPGPCVQSPEFTSTGPVLAQKRAVSQRRYRSTTLAPGGWASSSAPPSPRWEHFVHRAAHRGALQGRDPVLDRQSRLRVLGRDPEDAGERHP